MEEILNQIRKTIKYKLYYLALSMAVAISDICSALQSENNKTDSKKYKNWFNFYLAKRNPNNYEPKGQLTAEHLGSIRCSLLHQGITRAKKDYKRLKVAKQWLIDNKNNKFYIKNYEKLIKRYPKGVAPVFGTPVIG